MARTRKTFPTRGIYACVGGIAGCYYLDPADARRYRYLRPARHGAMPTCVIADCWIVDRNGRRNPGTLNAPVPVCLEAIGRRIAL